MFVFLASAVIDKLETILYHDKEALNTFVENRKVALPDGQDLAFCRLVPSYSDRRAFFTCILEGIVELTDDNDEDEDTTRVPFQRLAKRYFDSQISSRLEQLTTKEARLEELKSLTTLALEKMGLTMVEVLNEIDLPQVGKIVLEK